MRNGMTTRDNPLPRRRRMNRSHAPVVLLLVACCCWLPFHEVTAGFALSVPRQQQQRRRQRQRHSVPMDPNRNAFPTKIQHCHSSPKGIEHRSWLTAVPVDDDDNNDDDTATRLDEILRVAIVASKQAGDIILGHAQGADVVELKANSRDLLTLIDPLCEQTIRDTVLTAFPLHNFLGEEDVLPGKEASAAALNAKLQAAAAVDTDTGDDDGWLWIVDPIDGTTNFVHGMPLCMPSVAATQHGRVMVGVIYDCHRDELFTAIRGRGAFLNGQPITVGQQETLGDAIVAMGSPPATESMAMSVKGVAVLMPRVRTIRMLGSAALMLAWVANGRLTSYWEYDLSSWDIAAGALIIQEAGGRFTDLEGNDFTLQTRKICASNGKIHNELLRVLREEAGIV